MRIAIVGAGAMGGLFAARIFDSGHRLVLVDVNQKLIGAIQENGLTLIEGPVEKRCYPVIGRASDFVEEVDVIIFLTKSQHTRGAAESCRHLVSSHTVVLSLQNGLGGPEVLEEVFSTSRILMGITTCPADAVSLGVVETEPAGEVRIGARSQGVDDCVPVLVDILNDAGFRCVSDPHVRVAVWEKVAFNTALNYLCAICRVPVSVVRDSHCAREIAFSAAREVAEVARAVGVEVNPQRIVESIVHALETQGTHKPSMLQDLENGRLTEVDAISGAVLKLATDHGVSTPVTKMLDSLIRVTELPVGLR